LPEQVGRPAEEKIVAAAGGKPAVGAEETDAEDARGRTRTRCRRRMKKTHEKMGSAASAAEEEEEGACVTPKNALEDNVSLCRDEEAVEDDELGTLPRESA